MAQVWQWGAKPSSEPSESERGEAKVRPLWHFDLRQWRWLLAFYRNPSRYRSLLPPRRLPPFDFLQFDCSINACRPRLAPRCGLASPRSDSSGAAPGRRICCSAMVIPLTDRVPMEFLLCCCGWKRGGFVSCVALVVGGLWNCYRLVWWFCICGGTWIGWKYWTLGCFVARIIASVVEFSSCIFFCSRGII